MATQQKEGRVVILGIYVTDLTFRADRMPLIGETVAGNAFKMGPGGKGSNQAVAAARAGADVVFCTRIGNDAFGAIARVPWQCRFRSHRHRPHSSCPPRPTRR